MSQGRRQSSCAGAADDAADDGARAAHQALFNLRFQAATRQLADVLADAQGEKP